MEEDLGKAGYRYIGNDIKEHIIPLKVTHTVTLNGHFMIRTNGRKKVKLASLKPRLTKDQKLLPKNLYRYSDYCQFQASLSLFDSDFEDIKNRVLLSLLKNNQRGKLFVCSALPNDYNMARRVFGSMIDEPNIELNKETLKLHKNRMRAYLLHNTENNSIRDCRMFAEYYPQLQDFRKEYQIRKLENLPEYKEFKDRVCLALNQRVKERFMAWREDFKGLKWITKNPGSQHTSSINPIMEDPRMFYRNCYQPFTVGIAPEVEICIRALFKNVFPPEIIKLIIQEVVYRTHISPNPTSLKRKNEQNVKDRKKIRLL
eukprot:TRINITY_DN1335_c0_g1_i8.p1 TRINITY_DN1335_c0_g1~~TRINITY_DN1335_c0_g1_i8.p1  ORF type:complete len:315 (+),score=72.38 TRINITY_DN1335_c0_g1_i8:797-1741(+)